MIKLYYPQGSDNVGDELNGWLWPALLGDVRHESDVALLGIGTLLNEPFCRQLRAEQRIVVLGTGAGYGAPPQLDERWKVYAVRGPRTATALGLSASLAIADSAYLLAGLDWRSEVPAKRVGEVLVVPHHRSLPLLDWQALCDRAGLTFLSPLLPAETFMARLVLAEAMHGAILADVVRVPWRAFSFGRQFNLDKWLDWSESLEIELDVHKVQGFYDPNYARHQSTRQVKHLLRSLKAKCCACGLGRAKWCSITPPSWRVAHDTNLLATTLQVLAGEMGQLSDDQVFRHRVTQLLSTVNALRTDLGAAPSKGLSGSPADFFRGEMQ
jgi:succinoglycan biosynthesis protein ExoV